jgi:hypothetical protein
MEYADGGDLYGKIQDYKKRGVHIPENDVWKIFI